MHRGDRFCHRKLIVSIPVAAKELGFTVPVVTKSFLHLEELGIVREITGKRRGRLFTYEAGLRILLEDTETG